MKFLQRTINLDKHIATFLYTRAREQRHHAQKAIAIAKKSYSSESPEVEVLSLQYAMTASIATMFQEHKSSDEILAAIENNSPRSFSEFPLELSEWRKHFPETIIEILVTDNNPSVAMLVPSSSCRYRRLSRKRKRYKGK